MKLASGDWVAVLQNGFEKGVERFGYDGAPIPHDELHAALKAGRVGMSMPGFKRGERIHTGVQVNALPDGAMTVNPATGQECVKVGDHMEHDGKPLPDYAFIRTNTLWKD